MSLPDSWTSICLADSAWLVPTGVKPYDGDVEYYSTGSVKDTGFVPEGRYKFANRIARANRRVRKWDVLQARMASANKPVLVNDRLDGALFSTGFLQWRFQLEAETIGPWVYYAIQGPHFLAARDSLASGTTQVALNDKGLAKIFIPVAPVNEQRRIIAALEAGLTKLDAAVSELQKVRTKLRSYRMSVLQAACNGGLTRTPRPKDLPPDWAFAALAGQVSEGPQNGLYLPKTEYGAGTPIVRIKDLQNYKGFRAADLEQVRISSEVEATYALREDDLLLNRVNSPAWLGKTIAIRSANLPAVFESNMMRFRVGPGLLPRYLEIYFESRPGRSRLTANSKWAVNQASINQQDVLQTLVPIPPIAEQLRIVAEVDRRLSLADAVAGEVEAGLKQCARLRQALLRKAFEGRLVPQNPGDEPAEALVDRIRKLAVGAAMKGKRKKV